MNTSHDDNLFKTDDLELEKIIAEINNEKLTAAEQQIIDEDILESLEDLQPKNKKDKARMELHDWVQCVVGAIVIGIVIFVFFGRSIGVDGISMMSTLRHNDRIIMSNLFYTPQNGDVLVFQTGCDEFGGNPLVKRVIAMEGQTVDINFDCGHVYVDGILLCEPYLDEPTFVRNNFEGPVIVEEGHIFVMGDNRNHSSDSRDSRIGQIDTRKILGRVLIIAIPGPDAFGNRDWNRFGWIDDGIPCPYGYKCICNIDCGCMA